MIQMLSNILTHHSLKKVQYAFINKSTNCYRNLFARRVMREQSMTCNTGMDNLNKGKNAEFSVVMNTN